MVEKKEIAEFSFQLCARDCLDCQHLASVWWSPAWERLEVWERAIHFADARGLFCAACAEPPEGGTPSGEAAIITVAR